MGRVATIARVPSELWTIAKALIPLLAIRTYAAGGSEPGNADAHPRPESVDIRADPIDASDDFVTGNDRQLRTGQFAIDDMKVSPANAAGRDPHAHFARDRLRVGQLGKNKRLSGLLLRPIATTIEKRGPASDIDTVVVGGDWP